MPRAEKEDANEFHVDFEENTKIIPQDGMLSLSPVSIHDGQVTDITENVLKKAHKSIVQEIGPPPKVPTGPAADRGRLKMYRPGRANPTKLGRITINGEHKRHLEITKWLCMQATKVHGEISARSGSRANILCRRIFLTCGRGFDAFKARGYRGTLRALHNRRRLWSFFSKIIEEYLPLSKQRSAPKPKAESLPQVSKSTSTPMASTLVPKSTPTAIDFFRRPLKGSKPWPCDPNELRNKSPIQARSGESGSCRS
ncbi:hypothetical protein NOF04DRAFT_16664 [Fusarium oxysporum II5]|uniref:Uncharacterized protein n=1 Tax=Fusarium odoratissimum (strain NRRL 54006) TaxID=1089451 RepID=X0IRT5_FUSO5|nr:uncharacterized protein FOIG_15165 [Fusarium odoratissimum NRRL 54006]EXL91628.1 hypothetical protein FOIG_15165 [Fusarium odoratissimum NRRL 54006]KAK2133215.1 hypothetical protein NOF04DRAFT_16664 [Fusarium oxysporum II5]